MCETAMPEEVISFSCGEDRMWGIVSRPPVDAAPSQTAVVIVVGGPQYRVGSHRQFVLLARSLAQHGFATLRFDYRGMGDSEGAMRTFEGVGPDIEAALGAMCRACPHVERIVVWGLCDAASAALMFATADSRVVGVVAANPWARSEASLAATQIKHYYAARLTQKEFWAKLLRGGLNWRTSFGALVGNLKRARGRRRSSVSTDGAASFHDRMARGLGSFPGRVLLILSGNDLTAEEFVHYTASNAAWNGLLADPKVERIDIAEADHTFSQRAWQVAVEDATIAWLNSLRVIAEPSTA